VSKGVQQVSTLYCDNPLAADLHEVHSVEEDVPASVLHRSVNVYSKMEQTYYEGQYFSSFPCSGKIIYTSLPYGTQNDILL